MLKKREKQIIVIEMNIFFLYIMMISMMLMSKGILTSMISNCSQKYLTLRSPHMD